MGKRHHKQQEIVCGAREMNKSGGTITHCHVWWYNDMTGRFSLNRSTYVCLQHRYKKEIPDSSITPCNGIVSHVGLQIFADHTPQNKHKQNKRIHDLPTSCGVLRVFILMPQTAVDVGDIHTWRTRVILITEKPEDPQFEPHAGIKNGVGSGISLVYQWS